MTLESIYYIGQTIAVGAILVSLAAIYWQQRQANQIARTENLGNLAGGYAASLRDIMVHRDLAEIFRKVMFEGIPLDATETTRILLYFNQLLIDHRSVWAAWEQGLFDRQILEDHNANTAWYLSVPLFEAEWRRCRKIGLYSGTFGDHVDTLAAASSPSTQQAPIEGQDRQELANLPKEDQ